MRNERFSEIVQVVDPATTEKDTNCMQCTGADDTL
jgi:hypothetical protein